MNKISFIAMHHSGGFANDYYAKSQHLTAAHINNAHRDRWQFLSNLGYYGGYNFYVEANGKVTQFRQIGEETAAQLGHNFDTISICVAGNFAKKNGVPVETPTEWQKIAVCKLLGDLIEEVYWGLGVAPRTIINVTEASIHHHRFFQSSTECDALPDDFWRLEMKARAPKPIEPSVPSSDGALKLVDAIIALLIQLKEHLKVVFAKKTVGGVDRAHCGGY